MSSLLSRIAAFGFAALAICACSNSSLNPSAGLHDSASRIAPESSRATASQYLYVYNTGIPGSVPAQYARYSIPDLSVQETSQADGLASQIAFGSNSQPYFVDEATGHTGFAVYLLPIAKGAVNAKQLFYGIPCRAVSLSTGPTGNFYVDQYCSTDALEFTPTKKKKNPKKPLATFKGGNLGKGGITGPTYVIVDPKGNLYVGDNGGGVTYFAAGSKRGVVAYKTGHGGYVNQMAVDKNGDVWSVHGPDTTAKYFKDATHCVLSKKGKYVRNEFGERFSNGKLVQTLYTTISTSPLFSDNGVSIAVDSTGRVYTGNQNSSVPGVVLDFDPGASCPNDGLSLALDNGANPQVAVDATGTYYVTDYHDNTISAYTGGSTTLLKKIAQRSGLTNITYTAINP